MFLNSYYYIFIYNYVIFVLFLILLFSIFFIIIYIVNNNYVNQEVNLEEEEEEEEEEENEDKEENTQNNEDNNKFNDKDLQILKSLDDTKDPNLQIFKIRLQEVKKSFGNYWNNYYNWHYSYNGDYKLFNWFRFNKWSWKKKDYDNLKKKSDSDFVKLKLAWLRFQEAYFKISRNSPYHDLVTRIYLRHYDLLQLIKKSIKDNFSKK